MDIAKQITLKPQDLVVALKISLYRDGMPTFAELSRSLQISTSETHAAAQRAMHSRLLVMEDGHIRANKSTLLEFAIYGACYAFPISEGPVMRGMPTGASAPAMRKQFDHAGMMQLVWPYVGGTERGRSIIPLYAKAPVACEADSELYAILAALDSVRGGAAREREAAVNLIRQALA